MSERAPSLARLFVHPLKSGGGHEVARWPLGATGLLHDRGLMLVNPEGDFVTLRGTPRLVTIRPAPFGFDADTVTFCAPSLPDFAVELTAPASHASVQRVQIWGDWVDAQVVSNEADAWFSDALDRPVRLVRYDPNRARTVDQRYARPDDTVGFADGFPLLVTGSASLDAVARGVAEAGGVEVTVERFRPNLVIATEVPWIEDTWRRIRVGGVELELVKPCGRCVGINVDPVTGRAGREPLRTLAKTRTRDGQVFFGHNAIHRSVGWLAVGDPVDVLELAT